MLFLPQEISWDFLMSFHAFFFTLFEISLWEFVLFSCIMILWDCMRFAVQLLCEISFWNFVLSAAQFSCKMSLFDFTPFWPLWGFRLRFMEMSWDFLVRFHAFGSLCDFLLNFVAFFRIFVWWDFTFIRRYEISLWDFMLFVAYFVLIYVSPKSPPWNAS
jgi:hypothetical protein